MATHTGLLPHLHTLPGGTGQCPLPTPPDPPDPSALPHPRLGSVWGTHWKSWVSAQRGWGGGDSRLQLQTQTYSHVHR